MDTQVLFDLLELSIEDLPHRVVRGFLEQSLLNYEQRDWGRMSELAQEAKLCAQSQNDRLGEAVALIHQGIAFAHTEKLAEAQDALKRANRIFHRDPSWRHRLGEGLATLALGLVEPLRFEALNYHQEALNLLSQLEERYAAEGDIDKQAKIRGVCRLLRLKISGQTPVVRVGDRRYVLTVPRYRDEIPLELEPDVEYRIIPIGRDRYNEDFENFGLSINDSVLVRRVRRIDEILPGDLGVWHTSGGDYVFGKFERNTDGSVQFIQIGAESKILNVQNVRAIRCIDAVLKPTWSPT